MFASTEAIAMLATALSAAIVGVDGVPVRVEVDVSFGLPGLTIVGLAGSAVLEARERVRAAIRNSGFEVPARRITVNLAPASGTTNEPPVIDADQDRRGAAAKLRRYPPPELAGRIGASGCGRLPYARPDASANELLPGCSRDHSRPYGERCGR